MNQSTGAPNQNKSQGGRYNSKRFILFLLGIAINLIRMSFKIGDQI
jgi:hypothetical protein